MSHPKVFIGNLTADPTLKELDGGKSVCNVGLAENRSYRRSDDDHWQTSTTFYEVTAWETDAQRLAASLHKGDRVVVVGRLETEQFTAKDGTAKMALRIHADEVAASLKWAEADVSRVASSNGSAD